MKQKGMRNFLLNIAGASVLSFGALATANSQSTADTQVLVEIGGRPLTSVELERTLASSPFATQFNTMNEQDQAALRGDLLRRLVSQRLLLLEAHRLGLDKLPAFVRERRDYRAGLLYRHYMDKLRASLVPPQSVLQEIAEQFPDDPDGQQAAQSAWRVDAYRTLRLETIRRLRARYHVKLQEQRINPVMTPDTVLLTGDGLRITAGDLYPGAASLPAPSAVRERLYSRAERDLIAKAATDEGVDISAALGAFENERLPALLLEQKSREWVPDESVTRQFFTEHPEISQIPARLHVGQIVVAEKELAEKLRSRIQDGESLFLLAEQYSIDPYGKAHRGDMGWVMQGSGLPQIEQGIADLEDNQLSPVIKTPRGYHLVMIIERRPGGTRAYAAVKDAIRQAIINQQTANYVSQLERQYGVVWKLIKPTAKPVNG